MYSPVVAERDMGKQTMSKTGVSVKDGVASIKSPRTVAMVAAAATLGPLLLLAFSTTLTQ